MPKIDLAEPGTICLIIQEPNERVCQLATTVEQSKVLQILIASMSKEIPLVKMSEEQDLVLKKHKYSEGHRIFHAFDCKGLPDLKFKFQTSVDKENKN